jgi:23S rRNA (adenine2503-C2)-methyltransferase
MAAGELMRNPSAGALSAKAITVSTVGLVPEIERFTLEGRKFRLSISLGAAIDAKRREIFPVAGRTPLPRLMEAARHHAAARGGRIMLSYVLISGFNVGEEDAIALAELVGDTPIRLSLIDVTDPTGRFKPPGAEELSAFRDALTKHLAQPVVRRYSGGADIDGACGTLAGRASSLPASPG